MSFLTRSPCFSRSVGSSAKVLALLAALTPKVPANSERECSRCECLAVRIACIPCRCIFCPLVLMRNSEGGGLDGLGSCKRILHVLLCAEYFLYSTEGTSHLLTLLPRRAEVREVREELSAKAVSTEIFHLHNLPAVNRPLPLYIVTKNVFCTP